MDLLSPQDVILNGDSPVSTRVVEGVSQPVAPTTAEQKLARKNELEPHGTLLMDLLDKHQSKFNTHKKAKTLMEAIEKRFGGNTKTKKVQNTLLKQQYKNFTGSSSKSLDQIHNKLQKLRNKADLEEQSLDDLFSNLKIYETEVKNSSSTGTVTQNLAFVSSCNTDSATNLISAAASVSAVCAKMPVSSLHNVDSLSNAVVTRSLLVNLLVLSRNLRANGPTSMGFDMSKVKCYNCYRNGHFARKCRSPKDSRRTGSYDWSYQAEEEPANYALTAFSSSSSSFDNESDCESWPPSCLYDSFQPSGGYHAVLPSYIGTFMPPKPDLVFNTALAAVETEHLAFNVQLSPTKLDQDLSYTTRPTTPIIEEWVFDSKDESETKATYSGKKRNSKACFVCKSMDHLIKDCDYHAKKMAQSTSRNYAHRVLTQSKPVFNNAVRPVSAVVPKINVTRPRYAHPIITKSKSPIRRHITRSLSQRPIIHLPELLLFRLQWVINPQHTLKDKGVIDSGCSRHMIGNMSYLSDFEELNGGYVAFGGTPRVDLKFNLFSVSQRCDKKNNVLFTNTECLVLSPDFELPDASQVLLRVLRENNMYNVNLKNIAHSGDLTCLFAKSTIDESTLWHKRLGHRNFKTINKVVKGNLVRGLPTKVFENENTCVGCKKGKKHRASCKTKPISFVDQTLYRLHMDLFGLTFVKSLNKKSYCLVVTDDYSRSDNRTEFKNNNLNQFCGIKGIKREFSVPRTPRQNGIVERKNMTLIEAARTMLAYSLLPIPFWAEAINTTCYVQNRVLVTKPHNKTPYELLHGRTPSIGFMRPFGCLVTILNTLDPLGKFKRKVDERFIVGYSLSSKAFKVFNDRNHIVQETFHVNFLENNPNVTGSGPTWLFDIDSLTRTMNYQPVNNYDGDATFNGKERDFDAKKPESEVNVSPSSRYRDLSVEFEDFSDNSSNEVNAAGTIVPTVGRNSLNSTNTFSAAELKDITYSDDEDAVGAEADFNNLEPSITEELLQFKMQKFWVLVDLPHGKRAIGRIEGIRLFLAYASFMGFMVYQMDVKSAFLYGTIEEEVYVCQLLGFKYPDHLDKVYKVVKNYVDDIIFGATNKDLCKSFEKLMKDKFQMSSMRVLFVSSTSTPIDTEKPLLKDSDGKDVDVHTCRVGKGFSGVETPLFEGMLVGQEIKEEGDADKHVEDVTASDDAHRDDTAAHAEVPTVTQEPSIPSPMLPTPPPQPPQDLPSTSQVQQTPPQPPQDLLSTSQKLVKRNKVRVLKLRRLKRVGISQRVDTSDDTVIDDESNQGRMIAEINKDDVVVMMDDKEEDKKVEEAKEDETEPAKVQEVVDVVTTAKLIIEVVTAASTIIPTTEPQVSAAILIAAPARVAIAHSKRRKGVVIRDPEEESTISTIILVKIKSKDKGKRIWVEEPKPLKKKQQIKMDEEYAKKLHAELNKDIYWDEAINHLKRKAKEDPAVKKY
nr:hypothetical protein [Tanacetum cinerariifolium]